MQIPNCVRTGPNYKWTEKSELEVADTLLTIVSTPLCVREARHLPVDLGLESSIPASVLIQVDL